jgi:CelD/BcsL family acetyltransferase involved in cellulose biosynthesis
MVTHVSSRADLLRVELVGSLDGLEALAPAWDALVRAMPRPSPYLLHGMVCEWWRVLAGHRSLAVAVGRRGERVVGIAPLCVTPRRGVRVGEFLGAHESALGDVLLAPGEGPQTTAALLRSLQGSFDLVDLFGLPGGSSLVAGAPAGSLSVLERVEAPVLTMPDGWEAAYAERTSSKTRNTHRRRVRQLGELGAVEWRVALEPDELVLALEDAFRLHELRWEGRPDGSTFGSEEGRRYHRAAVARLAPDGVPRIVTLLVGGRPVAFHYYLALADTMYVHRLAFDPDPALARYSPGLVTTLRTLELASEQGLRRVEFLGGDERYKLELADGVEPLHQAIGLAGGPRGALVGHARLGAIRARRRLKRSPALKRLYDTGLAPLRRARARLG